MDGTPTMMNSSTRFFCNSGHGTQKTKDGVIFFKGGIALHCSAQDAEPMPMRNAAADLTRDARSLRRAAAPGDPW